MDKRLRLDFMTSAENTLHAEGESLAGILEKLSAIKSKHQLLCSELLTVGSAQKDTIDSISVNLANTMDLIQQFHHTTDVEVESLAASLHKPPHLQDFSVTEARTYQD
ncbi:SKA complex subunit 2 isoform X2 [Nelusetta ayraudi]